MYFLNKYELCVTVAIALPIPGIRKFEKMKAEEFQQIGEIRMFIKIFKVCFHV